jgi:hypothetical protein
MLITLHPQNSPDGLRQLRLRSLHFADSRNEKGAMPLMPAPPPAVIRRDSLKERTTECPLFRENVTILYAEEKKNDQNSSLRR